MADMMEQTLEQRSRVIADEHHARVISSTGFDTNELKNKHYLMVSAGDGNEWYIIFDGYSDQDTNASAAHEAYFQSGILNHANTNKGFGN